MVNFKSIRRKAAKFKNIMIYYIEIGLFQITKDQQPLQKQPHTITYPLIHITQIAQTTQPQILTSYLQNMNNTQSN